MNARIKWGIMGTGRIAEIFTSELKNLPDAIVSAVGSRNKSKARGFAERFGIPHYFGSYDELVSGSDIDIVYIATPHSRHSENTQLALQANKHVLCEKPFSINHEEAQTMISLAKKKNRFLMDALWIRFTPLMQWVKQAIHDGLLGEPGIFSGSFGYNMEFDPESRVYKRELGGGALLDVGIYPLSTGIWLMGNPVETVALAKLGMTGIDERTGIVMKTRDNKISTIYTSVINRTPGEFTVMGDKGFINVHGPWWHLDKLTIHLNSGKSDIISFPLEERGYIYMARHVMTCLREGKTESPVVPLSETVSIMTIMDTIRKQIGLKYPME
jgi:predicted dehydrogenase